jgi:predicted metalloprotease with PDZ domain
VTLTVFRRDELVNVSVPVEHGPPQRFAIRRAQDATEEEQAVMADWLRCVVPREAPAPPAVDR